MISLKVVEVKPFMAKLLTDQRFDFFCLREIEIQSFVNFHINGKLNHDYYTKEELESRDDSGIILWEEIRPTAYSVIKGNRTPLSMKIIFQLPADKIGQSGGFETSFRRENIGGLFLNIRFERGELHIITGAAMKTFSLDKSLEQEWDAWVQKLFKDWEIAIELTQ